MVDASWKVAPPGPPRDYNDPLNWNETVVPNGTATFGGNANLGVYINANATVGGWHFAAGSPFIFSVGADLTFNGAGITGGIFASFVTLANSGRVFFRGSSSAGDISITNDDIVVFFDTSTAGNAKITNTSDASTAFLNGSSAGTATITNNSTSSNGLDFAGESSAGSATINNNGSLRFFGTATAGNATIVTNASSSINFADTTTAGSATITNNDSVTFGEQSTAGNATIVNGANAEVHFDDNASGGNARIANEGTTYFHGSGPAGNGQIGLGSISGGGVFHFDPNVHLTVGSNNLSTVVSGVIVGDTNDSLIKVGTGTLTVAAPGGINLDGGTTIKAGTLKVDGKITGGVTVNDNGTLGGSGEVDLVTVDDGGTLSPGGSVGRLSTGNLTFQAESIFRAEIGGADPGTGYDQVDVTGTLKLGSPRLSGVLTGGFSPSKTTPQKFVLIDNDGIDKTIGTFLDLSEGEATIVGNRFFTVSYKGGTGNDVVLTSGGANITGTNAANTINSSTAPSGQPRATSLDDTISGLGGNDKLDGGRGRDTMRGGTGSDTYTVDNTGDRISENGGSGVDLVKSSISFKLLGGQVQGKVEDLILTGSKAINGTGSAYANDIVGNAKANTLQGLNGNDDLRGGSGNDKLDGGNGNDILTGGAGRDALTGGAGRDIFDFNFATESTRGSNRDTISGFSRAQHDRIDLRTIDADRDGAAGNQAFTFIGDDAFSGIDGQLRFSGGLVQGDTNGDRIADFEIRVTGVSSMIAGDFLP